MEKSAPGMSFGTDSTGRDPGNAVARWLEKAADVCRGFNQRRTAGLATRGLTFREVFVCLPPSLLVSIGALTCAVPSRLPTTPIVDELLAA